MLVDIWNNAGDLDLINADRKERGQKPVKNVKIIDLRYPSENADDLFDYVYDILLDDVWSCNEEQIEKVLNELGLIDFKDFHPMVLSGGQKQRLVIANAILSNKQIFVFDEPTSGLDYEGMLVVSKEIKKLSKKGYYIFIVSHDIEFINKTCNRIYEF